MRNYAKDYKNFPRTKPYVTKKQYAERTTNEWDIRIDIANGITPDGLLESITMHLDEVVYVMIGGVEQPDDLAAGPTGSKDHHVHIALVTMEPTNRATALGFFRAEKVSDEYASPRNQKFTYAGWLAHHSKLAFKLDTEADPILFEYGTAPLDHYDRETCWKVVRILKKFGNPDMKARFKSYYDALDTYKALAAPSPAAPGTATNPLFVDHPFIVNNESDHFSM